MAKLISFEKIYLKNKTKYFGKNLLLDTGPLLFLLGSLMDIKKIGETLLTKGYTQEDFEKLQYFISKFDKIIITPQILLETYHLIKRDIKNKNNFEKFIEESIKKLKELGELHIEKNKILDKKEFIYIGITDMSLLISSEETDQMILTKDFPFAELCRKRGLPIIHFDEIRFS